MRRYKETSSWGGASFDKYYMWYERRKGEISWQGIIRM